MWPKCIITLCTYYNYNTFYLNLILNVNVAILFRKIIKTILCINGFTQLILFFNNLKYTYIQFNEANDCKYNWLEL